MKLNFEQKACISNLPPKITPVANDELFIYYCTPNVVITSISTGKILHKYKYDDVQTLKIHENHLYICTNDIYVLDLINFEIKTYIKLSKALINNISLFDDRILFSKMDNTFQYLHNIEFKTDNYCEILFLSSRVFGYYDSQKVVVYSEKNTKIAEFESETVVGVHSCEKAVFVMESDGGLTELISGEKQYLKIDVDSCFFTSDRIFCVSGKDLLITDYKGKLQSKSDIRTAIENYSGVVNEECIRKSNFELSDNQKRKKVKKTDPEEESKVTELLCSSENNEETNMSDNSSMCDESAISDDNSSMCDESAISDDNNASVEQKNVDFILISSCLLKSSENDYIFFQESCIVKIYSFVDDLTDALNFNEFLIVTTTSGYLKYTMNTNYDMGENLFDAKLIKVHQSSITAAKLCGSILVTSSKDRTVCFFKANRTFDKISFTRIFEIADFNADIVTFAYVNTVLAIATSDFILHLFKTSLAFPENDEIQAYANFFATFENISVQKIHTKAITYLTILPNFIITASSDKTAKVVDLNGIVIKTIQSDRILNVSFNNKYIAICSHKAAKIFTNPALSPVCSFQARRPILSSSFYNDYFLGISDVLRVYDINKRKCVKSYDLGLDNCWCMAFPALCGENKIVFLEDVSKEYSEANTNTQRMLKEGTVLFEKFIYEKEFTKALNTIFDNDVENTKKNVNQAVIDRRIFHVISQGYFHNQHLEFLDPFMSNGNHKTRIFEVLIKNCGLKYSQVFNEAVSRFFTCKIEKKKKEKIFEIVEKHAEAIDNIFLEFSSLDIFRKKI
ncbi:hypothetical protein GINT2_001518 [Glugoides intestinalis]